MLVSLVILFSIRADEGSTAQTNPDGVLCQATGAAVAYFQLATMFWLAAGSHSVYTFVCKKKVTGSIAVPVPKLVISAKSKVSDKATEISGGEGMQTGFAARMEAGKARGAAMAAAKAEQVAAKGEAEAAVKAEADAKVAAVKLKVAEKREARAKEIKQRAVAATPEGGEPQLEVGGGGTGATDSDAGSTTELAEQSPSQGPTAEQAADDTAAPPPPGGGGASPPDASPVDTGDGPGAEEDETALGGLVVKKEIHIVQFYSAPCWGIPAILVACMLSFQSPSAFGYQRLNNAGWCTISMELPTVAFFFYNTPMLVCMYNVAACYYFCFSKVKAKRTVLEQIDNKVMYDRSAHMIRRKTFQSYQRNHMAAQAVRLSLIVMIGCWGPVCVYGLLLMASKVGGFSGNRAMGAVAKFRAFSSMVSPLFGVFLFIVFEIRFKFRHLYADTFHRYVRLLKFHVCKCCKMGPPKLKMRPVRDEEDEEEEEDDGLSLW